MMEAMIRNMTAADIDAVFAISEEAFNDPWSRESLEKEAVNPDAHYLVAEAGGKILGYVGYWQVLDEGHIMNVAVKESARGMGLGTLLVDSMLRQGKPMGIMFWTLEVRASNVPAIRLYENAGFVSAGRRPGYYSNPKEDAFIYWLKDEE